MNKQILKYCGLIDVKDLITIFLSILSMVFWAGVFYFVLAFPATQTEFAILFLGGSILIYCLSELNTSVNESKHHDSIALVVVSVVSSIVTVYAYTNYYEMTAVRTGFANNTDLFMGVLIIGALLYLVYREYGTMFSLVLVSFIFYSIVGGLFPGQLGHIGLTWRQVLQLSVTELNGVYGGLTQIVALYISLFVLLSGFFKSYGGFDLIVLFSSRIAKVVKTGVGLTAVVASMIIGSINGSGAANVAITGSLTIPMMKESNISSRAAAAIESSASIGGQTLPPVMGAAAFLMMAVIGVSYLEVISAALVPGLIFFLVVLFGTHLMVQKELENLPLETEKDKKRVPVDMSNWKLITEGLRFGIPIFTIIFLLAILRYSVMYTAAISVFAMLITGISMPLIERPTPNNVLNVLAKTKDGLVQGATLIAPITLIVAAINMVLDLLVATGTPASITQSLVEIAGGSLVVLVLLGMIVCIILGLGMPTSAAYLLVAILVAPAIAEPFGIPVLAVHFFVFYSAILSSITPPIAPALIIASSIADTDMWKSTIPTLKISTPLFLLPFTFISHPEIIVGDLMTSTIYGVAILMGCLLISVSLISDVSSHSKNANLLFKFMLFISGLMIMLYGSLPTKYIILLSIGSIALGRMIVGRKAVAVEP